MNAKASTPRTIRYREMEGILLNFSCLRQSSFPFVTQVVYITRAVLVPYQNLWKDLSTDLIEENF